VPSVLIAALSAQIREVQSLVGPGWSSDPTTDPASMLVGAQVALAEVSADAYRAWNRAAEHWSGTGAEGAAEFAASTVAAADALAARVDQLGATAQTAGAAVARANERLRAIVERFEARAAALEPHLDSPGVADELVAEAQRSLAEAVAVVDELRAELDGHAAALAAPTAPTSPAATTPAGLASPSMPSTGSGFGGGMPMSPLSGPGGMPSPGGGLGDLAAFSRPDAPLPDAAAFGDGFAVRLPDGSTAMAPNAVAASAVRHALTQLGVPYQWGGTTPGLGLDCSEYSAAGAGAGRRYGRKSGFVAAGRPGGVGRTRRDDRRQRNDDRSGRSGPPVADPNYQRGPGLSGILPADRVTTTLAILGPATANRVSKLAELRVGQLEGGFGPCQFRPAAHY
jgi:cell wall-associated NlpC family hydrolase